MKNQIIKAYIPEFNDFVKENFLYEGGLYIFNTLVFKKLLYENKVDAFLSQLKPYYYKNKQHYISHSPPTFNQFNTLLRQICKNNDVSYRSKVKYQSSKYNIEYYIKLSEYDADQSDTS